MEKKAKSMTPIKVIDHVKQGLVAHTLSYPHDILRTGLFFFTFVGISNEYILNDDV